MEFTFAGICDSSSKTYIRPHLECKQYFLFICDSVDVGFAALFVDSGACSFAVNYRIAFFFTQNMKWNHCSGPVPAQQISFSFMLSVNVAERNSVWFARISSSHARKAHETTYHQLIHVCVCVHLLNNMLDFANAIRKHHNVFFICLHKVSVK